jgi:hypothetical protein
LQAGGRRFDPGWLHFAKALVIGIVHISRPHILRALEAVMEAFLKPTKRDEDFGQHPPPEASVRIHAFALAGPNADAAPAPHA